MREKLRQFVSYEEGVKIRLALHERAKKHYKLKNTFQEYLSFMNSNECKFNINHAQSQNHPWYFCLFTIMSQHVYGDCIEECLDKAMIYEREI